MARPSSYEEFWPLYVRAHNKMPTQLCHVFGSLSGAIIALSALTMGWWLMIPLGVAWGYAWAWFSHFFIQRNRPETFRHPLWSLRGDWQMIYYFLTGRMRAEVERWGS